MQLLGKKKSFYDFLNAHNEFDRNLKISTALAFLEGVTL